MSDAENKNLKNFLAQLQTETQRAKFAEQVQVFTDRCWDVCYGDVSRMPSRMDGKTETCLTNCVNRMMDASALMIQHLQTMNGKRDITL